MGWWALHVVTHWWWWSLGCFVFTQTWYGLSFNGGSGSGHLMGMMVVTAWWWWSLHVSDRHPVQCGGGQIMVVEVSLHVSDGDSSVTSRLQSNL